MSQINNAGFTKDDTLKTKAIAVSLLAFHHLFNSVKRITAFDVQLSEYIQPEFVVTIAAASRVCVWIFAFLSAYGLALKYRKVRNEQSYFQFVYQQWWSLMKPFWFIYILSFAASFFILKHPATVYEGNYYYLIFDFLGIADLVQTPMLAGAWWYMSLAQILLLLMPLLVEFVERTGVCSIALLYVLVLFWNVDFSSVYGGRYTQYFYAVLMAILCANSNFFVRFGNKRGKLASCLEAVLLLAGFVLFAYLKVSLASTKFGSFNTILSGISVIFLCLFVQKYLTAPIISKPLKFLGKHSGNIFMIHGFVYIYYPSIVYWSHNVILSTITLILVSLVISVLLELLKKLIRYDKAITALSKALYLGDHSIKSDHTPTQLS